MAHSQHGWTLEMVHALPDDGNRYELINGELFVTPAPTRGHQRAVPKLARLLEDFAEQQGLEVLFAPLAVPIADGEVQPDIVVCPVVRPGSLLASRPLASSAAWICSQAPVGDRHPFAKPPNAECERRDIVGHLGDIVERNAWCFLQLKEKQIGERRLHAFDLGRKHCLVANVGVKEKELIWQQRRHAIETPNSKSGALDGRLQRANHLDGRHRRQWSGDERPYGLPANGSDAVRS